jgi:hypothetical protein
MKTGEWKHRSLFDDSDSSGHQQSADWTTMITIRAGFFLPMSDFDNGDHDDNDDDNVDFLSLVEAPADCDNHHAELLLSTAASTRSCGTPQSVIRDSVAAAIEAKDIEFEVEVEDATSYDVNPKSIISVARASSTNEKDTIGIEVGDTASSCAPAHTAATAPALSSPGIAKLASLPRSLPQTLVGGVLAKQWQVASPADLFKSMMKRAEAELRRLDGSGLGPHLDIRSSRFGVLEVENEGVLVTVYNDARWFVVLNDPDEQLIDGDDGDDDEAILGKRQYHKTRNSGTKKSNYFNYDDYDVSIFSSQPSQ